MMEAFADGIVESGSSPGGHGGECFVEILRVAGKGFPLHEFDGNVVIEIDDEHFILGIAGMNEKSDGRKNVGELGAHAAAVVNNETYGYGSVVLIEDRGSLQLAVFEYAKILELQAEDKRAVRSGYRDGQED